MIENVAESAGALFLIFVGGCLTVVRIASLLAYFQQEEYDSARYVYTIFRVRLFDIKASLLLFVLFAERMLWNAGFLPLLVCSILILIIAWQERSYTYKKPLIYTERAKRIYWVSIIPALIALLLGRGHPLFILFLLQVLPLFLLFANILLIPFQKQINRHYIESAKNKLKRMDPLRIGITGSFGKTTVKHICAEFLSLSGPVFYSRGSVNTELGLTRHIRERLQWGHCYFIAEMGAYGLGSICRLCSFIRPHHGIVTAIGDTHIERFGNIETIARAKSELVESVCKAGGQIVLNADVLQFQPFRKLKSYYGSQLISVGFDEEADIWIKRADFVDGMWEIELQGRCAHEFQMVYRLPLLGAHNVINSALAIVMASRIDPKIIKRLPFITSRVEQIPHRLQKKENEGKLLILDDSYNANEVGFKNAVQILSQLARERGGMAILVTPGLVELGYLHDQVHEELGLFCKGLCDRVYVVNPSRIPTFISALFHAGIDYSGVQNFSEAHRVILELYGKEARNVILYENDLPDLLEEMRFL
ncbi:MAG: UDP-N-acetylmuramoyl-tripeptide--D-alanyl-D-alanine ligase [Alphaproteobacteria bacterium]|nr:UDP-N-acetylmuramoyl-tripeptide--D-alanyl-D-alanine ligase [Alphaproteobacteria bacterium]